MTANCPECGTTITFSSNVAAGELVVCPDCGAELEVISVDPSTLALAPEVSEDWGQ
jgi:alpha-aminoadipate carrier protein LysW